MRPTNSKHKESAQLAADVEAFIAKGGVIQKLPIHTYNHDNMTIRQSMRKDFQIRTDR